jgi:endonuclease/exonuclease/phosphatase family metal-dependent hydrolase
MRAAIGPGRRDWSVESQAAVILAAVATVLMLEGVRVFVAYLVFVVDQANRVALGGSALGTFAAIGLGGLVARLGRSNAILAATAGLGLARLALQFWQQPEARVVLGAVTIMSWGWLVIALLRWHRSAVALGIPCGLALDLAIRITTGTVDLPWMPGVAEHLATVALVAALALAAFALRAAPVVDTGGVTSSLLALGPGLAVYHLMTGNLSYARYELDASLPAAAALLGLGAVLGIGFLALEPLIASRRTTLTGPLLLVVILLALTVTIVFFALPQALSPIALVLGAAVSLGMLALALQGFSADQDDTRVGMIAALVTLGMLVQAGLLFAYYTFTGSPRIAVAAWVAFILFTMLGGRERQSGASGRQPDTAFVPISAVVLVVVLACGWQWLAWDTPEAGSPLGAEFTAMTYNIQSGFAVDNVWSLEQTARTIEAANPDIVVLQEVGRGWLVTTNIDQIEWLSQRLDMEYAFGANSRDGLWGNAILSRAPILDRQRFAFDTTANLDRAVLAAEIETESGSLWVLGTHFDNPSGAGNIRLEQAEQLIEFWDGRSPALLLGDLNATPDSDTLAALAAAGFHDPGLDQLGDTTTSEDGKRIDYILTTDGLATTTMDVPQVWTSDHLPVVARISLTP